MVIVDEILLFKEKEYWGFDIVGEGIFKIVICSGEIKIYRNS